MEIFHTLHSMAAVINPKQDVESIFMELICFFFFSFHTREEGEDFSFSAIAKMHFQQHIF